MLHRKNLEATEQTRQFNTGGFGDHRAGEYGRLKDVTPSPYAERYKRKQNFMQLRAEAETALAAAREEYLSALRLPETTLKEAKRKSAVLIRVSRRLSEVEHAILRLGIQV